jgi:DNA repair exonuclease SbcCD ATPase subunit
LNDEKYNFEKLKKSKEEWSFTKKKAVLDLVATIKNLEKQKEEISNDDKETQAYNAALEDISTFEKSIVDLSESDSKLEKNKTVLDNAYENLLESQNICAGKHIEEKAKVASFKKDLSKIQSDINKIENLEDGVVCQHCLSTIDKSSHTHVLQSLITNKDEIIQKQTEAESSFAEVDRKLVSIKEKIGEISNKLVVLKTAQKKCNQEKELVTKKLNELKKIKKPEDNKKLQDIQNKIDVIKLQVKEKISELSSPTPYDDLVQTSEHNINNFDQEINVQSDAIKSMHEKTKYFEFWITAFGDSGIRKYIIDEIMPALNSSINYWMQFLIDNKISIKFNNEFEETIEKFPIEKGNFNYECMSNGQRRRINLALSQAFAHVMSLNSGKTPSLIFLDEVTSNIDPQGVAGIYNMICEMAKEKQVFVTTHDYDLIDFLNGCDNLNLVMRNAKTKLEK